MPRAFLIKKKLTAKSGSSSEKTWRHWSDPLSDEVEDGMDDIHGNRTLTNQLRTIDSVAVETRGPYDLSMKPKAMEDSVSLVNLSSEHQPTMLSPHRVTSAIAVVAPKPIKPTPKTPEDMASLKPWQSQMYSPYLPFNYTGYAYPSKQELYGANTASGYLMTHQSLAPPPLVPLSSSTSPNHVRERYSPIQDRYSSYDVHLRNRMSPPVVQSPSPPLAYSGWISDGQDSGLASSPSPSSEDGDLISNNPKHAANQTRYQCPDCNKSYSTYSGLSKHRLMHCSTQVKKSFSCKYCDKVYVSLGALKMHIRTHTLPCKCKLCGKAFSRPWLLQGHIRTHTGEKPFSCPHCSRAFADRSNLRAHLQTHSEVKKYRCKTCSKTFSRMSLLLKHEDGGCSGATTQV